MVRQIQGEYKAKANIWRTTSVVWNPVYNLSNWRVKRIPYEKNRKVDALVRVIAALPIKASIMLSVYIQLMPFIASEWVHDVAHASVGWMHPIANYLRTGEVLEDGKQAYKLRIKAIRFTLINNQLYKRSFGGPYLKCLTDSKTQYFLAELHENVCDNHPRGWTLAHRAYSQG